ncbi:uncharacterized protein LOC131321309 [Rhododendron vialii]|uniref:uncharacterized protein LOC131321309 n=1 Tax=Rhododendron vialii TaxID=182163 RepID=UPI00265E3B9C|nr:uncharacterized protein LOC131321309 [Rhododendron vialii]
MSNYTKLDFAVLDISGRNYLSWILDVEIYLDAMELGNTITDGNDASSKDCAKAMIFIRHHLHEDLKSEYLTVKDPLNLWNNLKERYGHQKAVILPNARYCWLNLRLQDYKSVSEYNSTLFKIVSILKLYREQITEKDMLEKTFSTFHANNLLLQQQYRERGFEKYSDLISCLLVAEQNNELLLRNHESRPTSALPFPKANRVSFPSNGQGRGHGQRRGRGSHNHQVHGGYIQKLGKKSEYPQKWNKWNRSEVSKEKGKRALNKPSKNSEDSCYKCGGKGHWSRTCRTPKHLIELYQASLKEKGKEIETDFTDQISQNQTVDPFEPIDIPFFDISEYLAGPSGTKDDFFGDGGDYSEWSQE